MNSKSVFHANGSIIWKIAIISQVLVNKTSNLNKNFKKRGLGKKHFWSAL